MLQRYYLQAEDTFVGEGYVELELTVFEILTLINQTLIQNRNKSFGFNLLKLFIKSNKDAKDYLVNVLKLDLNNKYILQAIKELEGDKHGKIKK